MATLFLKVTKIGFYMLLVMLFLSGARVEEKSFSLSTGPFDYSMKVSGTLNDNFKGMIDFEQIVEKTSKGIPISVLKMKLTSIDKITPHSFEFMIAKENMTQTLDIGTYKILDNQSGILNFFDGAIGFANIDELGELPLFAKKGKIKLHRLDNSDIAGSIDIEFNNAVGNQVQLKGNFKVVN